MSPVTGAAVSLRRILVKHPWIHWALVTIAAFGAAGSMLEHTDRVDATRGAWGETRRVWVATAAHAPGDALAVEARDVPAALVADGALEHVDGLVARQHIAPGEIVDRVDVVAPHGPQAMTPSGWLAVPVTESPASGASIGDRVLVVADGVEISSDAVVVGHHDEATLVAVPAAEGHMVAAGAADQGVTLLLVP